MVIRAVLEVPSTIDRPNSRCAHSINEYEPCFLSALVFFVFFISCILPIPLGEVLEGLAQNFLLKFVGSKNKINYAKNSGELNRNIG